MLSREAEVLKISGPINIDSVANLLAESGKLIRDVNVVDLGKVTEVDSSAISLMLEWQRQVQPKTLRFTNLPASLKSLAELYGVTGLIPQ